MRAALLETPIDDAENFAPARELRGEANLPTRRGDPSGFETCRSRADDHDFAPSPCCLCDHVRHGRLASSGGIVDAERIEADVDSIDAVTHADARADLAFATLSDLARNMRIGEMRARHADHIELA